MPRTVDSVLADLKARTNAQARKTYARHGVPLDRMFGVTVADLKIVAKTLRGDHALACELFETGNHDAMYLAGMVAGGAQMSRKQLESWAKATKGLAMIAQFTVPGVAVENPYARELAMKWIGSKEEHVASCGWSTYAGILATFPDESLDLKEIDGLLRNIERGIHAAQNRVRFTMNEFVISVGAYVTPLLNRAKETARAIGAVEVDMGDTACKVPLATAYIEKIEAAGRVGRKRKTIRC